MLTVVDALALIHKLVLPAPTDIILIQLKNAFLAQVDARYVQVSLFAYLAQPDTLLKLWHLYFLCLLNQYHVLHAPLLVLPALAQQ